MIFRLLDQKRSERGSDKDTTSTKGPEADPKLLARLARHDAANKQGVNEARDKLTANYQAFLTQLNSAYKLKQASQRARIEANYTAWASYFELIKGEFKEAWDFFGVVQQDVDGWHRVAPAGEATTYLAVGREGYSFAAGLEQNTKRGAPFPKKWLTVSLGLSSSYLAGIGDERLVGRVDLPEETLCGLERCQPKSLDDQERGADELRKRITAYPLVFTLSSYEKGQHTTSLPVSALEKHSLTEMVQTLLVALTNDDISALQTLLPSAAPLLLKA